MACVLAWVLVALSPTNAIAQEDIADVPFAEHELGAGPGRYFLIGDTSDPPEKGFGLIVVLPGGDGSADFRPFVQRIYKHAVPPGYLVAQPVAVQWRANQPIVWPTARSKVPGMRFTTERYVAAVVKDAGQRVALDPSRSMVLAWSSSGPAAYAMATMPEPPVRGFYITMSVFKPKQMGPLRMTDGRPFRIEHSPADRVCPMQMAEQARDALTEAGAVVDFVTYDGGHGWHGPIWQRMGDGFTWLDGQLTESTDPGETEASQPSDEAPIDSEEGTE